MLKGAKALIKANAPSISKTKRKILIVNFKEFDRFNFFQRYGLEFL